MDRMTVDNFEQEFQAISPESPPYSEFVVIKIRPPRISFSTEIPHPSFQKEKSEKKPTLNTTNIASL